MPKIVLFVKEGIHRHIEAEHCKIFFSGHMSETAKYYVEDFLQEIRGNGKMRDDKGFIRSEGKVREGFCGVFSGLGLFSS